MTSSVMTTTTPPSTPDDDFLGCSGDLSDAIAAVIAAYPTPLGCLAPQQMQTGAVSIELMRALNTCHYNWKQKLDARRGEKTPVAPEVIEYGEYLLSKEMSCLAYKNTTWSARLVNSTLEGAKEAGAKMVDVDCTVWRSLVVRYTYLREHSTNDQISLSKALLHYTLPGVAKYCNELHAPGFRVILGEIILFRDRMGDMCVVVAANWVKSKKKTKPSPFLAVTSPWSPPPSNPKESNHVP